MKPRVKTCIVIDSEQYWEIAGRACNASSPGACVETGIDPHDELPEVRKSLARHFGVKHVQSVHSDYRGNFWLVIDDESAKRLVAPRQDAPTSLGDPSTLINQVDRHARLVAKAYLNAIVEDENVDEARRKLVDLLIACPPEAAYTETDAYKANLLLAEANTDARVRRELFEPLSHSTFVEQGAAAIAIVKEELQKCNIPACLPFYLGDEKNDDDGVPCYRTDACKTAYCPFRTNRKEASS